jgi:putative IMPACT (imprinted ancient) family translation regulator
MLLEEEAKKAETTLANTVTKLVMSSKEANEVLKKVKVVESKCMNNEVSFEELDKNQRLTSKMGSDNEQQLEELSRKLGVQEEKLKRAVDRA